MEALAKIKERIAEKRTQLRRLEDALAVLEEELAPDIPVTGRVDLSTLPVSNRTSKKTLVAHVTDALDRIGDQQFTVAHVEALLAEQGNVPKVKSPRARIAVALKQLVKDRIIVMTFKGAGNVPNRYRRAGAEGTIDSADDSEPKVGGATLRQQGRLVPQTASARRTDKEKTDGTKNPAVATPH